MRFKDYLINEVQDYDVMDSPPISEKSIINDLQSIGFKNIKVEKDHMNPNKKGVFPTKTIEYSYISSETLDAKDATSPVNVSGIPEWIKKLSIDELKDYKADHKGMDDSTKKSMDRQILNLKYKQAHSKDFSPRVLLGLLKSKGYNTVKVTVNSDGMFKGVLKKGNGLIEVEIDKAPYNRSGYIELTVVTSERKLTDKEKEELKHKTRGSNDEYKKELEERKKDKLF